MNGQGKPGGSTLSPPGEFHPQEHSDDMRETQVAAFERIKDEGLMAKLRLAVYEAIFRLQRPDRGVTGAELDKHISTQQGTWTRSGSPRLIELVRLGVIEEIGERKCSVTGQTVLEYRTTGRIPDPDGLRKKWPKPSQKVLKEGLGEMRKLYRMAQAQGTAPEASYIKIAQWIAGMLKPEASHEK